ncbi:hypothetical protein ACL02T_10770 [Pseudonocardia sp. RS010]|uniref:hypothetical protein n=1 Tax=Pseudonocardia sp. RS010 TaxID=3385979 RepID=UPI0039A1D160
MTDHARRLLASKAPFCSSGKTGHPDSQTAARALRSARYLRHLDATGGRIPGRKEKLTYHCPACGWWHLAASSGRRRRGDYRHEDARRRHR